MNELHGTEFWRFWKPKMKYTNEQSLKFILSSYHIYSRTFQWMFCPNCDRFFAAISRKYKKRDIFDILMIITLEANMITREITPFFIYSLSSIRWYISFLHFQTFKTQFHGVPRLHYVLVCKLVIFMPKMTLLGLLSFTYYPIILIITQISFSYIKCPNFWYITCFVPNLIPLWPLSYWL